jgi:Fur family ferric uptake transcriptional regulator
MNPRSGSAKGRRPSGAAEPDPADQLRRNARRVTGPRQAILRILGRGRHPMSPKDIFAALHKGVCDLATVYRSLHLLRAMGIVQRFDWGDGIGRFELIHEGDNAHHHHLVCTRCAEVIELDECSVTGLDEEIARGNGFTEVTHKLEFFGVCPACRGQ